MKEVQAFAIDADGDYVSVDPGEITDVVERIKNILADYGDEHPSPVNIRSMHVGQIVCDLVRCECNRHYRMELAFELWESNDRAN